MKSELLLTAAEGANRVTERRKRKEVAAGESEDRVEATRYTSANCDGHEFEVLRQEALSPGRLRKKLTRGGALNDQRS